MVHGDVTWWGQTISRVGSDEDRVSACLAESDFSKFHWFCVGQKKQPTLHLTQHQCGAPCGKYLMRGESEGRYGGIDSTD